MTVPYTFGTATTSIPLSNLDSNFNTPITLGNTSIYLGNTTTTIGNLTLTNATISSGTVNITNVTVTTANVTNITVTGTANIATGNITTLTSTSITDSGLVSGRVTYASTGGLLVDSSSLVFNGTSLGIGTPSPEANAKLTVYGSGVAISKDSSTITPSGYDLKIRSASPKMGLHATGASQNMSIEFSGGGGANALLDVQSGDGLIINTNALERMRIDSSGNVGIGTTTPRAKLEVNGVGSFADGTAAAPTITFGNDLTVGLFRANNATLAFTTGGSERMRIDSSGNLLVGTTSALGTGKVGFLQSASGQVLVLRNSDASAPYGLVSEYTGAAPNSVTSQFIYCNDTGGLRMEVRSNGGIANYTANNVILSDRREKTNFTPATPYLDKICAIPVQTFNYIDQNLEEDGGLTLGVVAQDVQAVAPELVSEGNWGSKENPKMRLEIYQTDMQYALMKALQELKAEFDAYKATHP
jgi:hypothetical protein